MRSEMLRKIHEHHLGIEKCKRRARGLLYWPGMNSQIHDLVSKCNTCLLFKNKQQREPMKGYEIPDRPWQRVRIDLFELDSENFMMISDYYSKFFEIAKLANTKSSTVQPSWTTFWTIWYSRWNCKRQRPTICELRVPDVRTPPGTTSVIPRHLRYIHSRMAWLNEPYKLKKNSWKNQVREKRP